MALAPTTAALVAGIASGVAGLIVFLAIHHVWIKPIWFIAPPGLAIAALGGLALGWAYKEIRLGLPAPPWTALSVCGLMLAILLPAVLLSFTHGPLFDLATATIPPGQGRRVAVRVALELGLTAIVMGALAGWLIGRSGRATLATALAGFAFALGPGHNIPMFGTNPRAFKGLAIMAVVVVASSFCLVEVEARLGRR
jgi:hypothetical protein